MSQENVEIVRRILAAFDVGGDVDVGYALLDPAVVVDASRNIFNPATYRGIDGFRAWRAETDENWGDMRLEPLKFVDGGDHVVVISRLVGTGRDSGIEVRRTSAQIATVHHGRIRRWEIGYTDVDEALEAAGLSK